MKRAFLPNSCRIPSRDLLCMMASRRQSHSLGGGGTVACDAPGAEFGREVSQDHESKKQGQNRCCPRWGECSIPVAWLLHQCKCFPKSLTYPTAACGSHRGTGAAETLRGARVVPVEPIPARFTVGAFRVSTTLQASACKGKRGAPMRPHRSLPVAPADAWGLQHEASVSRTLHGRVPAAGGKLSAQTHTHTPTEASEAVPWRSHSTVREGLHMGELSSSAHF